MDLKKIYLYSIDFRLIHTDWIDGLCFPQIILHNEKVYKFHTFNRFIETNYLKLIPFVDPNQEKLFEEVSK